MSKDLTISKGTRPPLNKTESRQAMLGALAIKAEVAAKHHQSLVADLDQEIHERCRPLLDRLMKSLGLTVGETSVSPDVKIDGLNGYRYGRRSDFDLAVKLIGSDNPTDLLFHGDYESVKIRLSAKVEHVEVDFSYDKYEGRPIEELVSLTGLPEQVFHTMVQRHLHEAVSEIVGVLANDAYEKELTKWANSLLSTTRDTDELAKDERFQESVLEFIQKRTSIPALPNLD